jgi:hypothetical protein
LKASLLSCLKYAWGYIAAAVFAFERSVFHSFGPGRARPDLETAFTFPRTSVEEKIAKIWAQVLDVDQVGTHDCFLNWEETRCSPAR